MTDIHLRHLACEPSTGPCWLSECGKYVKTQLTTNRLKHVTCPSCHAVVENENITRLKLWWHRLMGTI